MLIRQTCRYQQPQKPTSTKTRIKTYHIQAVYDLIYSSQKPTSTKTRIKTPTELIQ